MGCFQGRLSAAMRYTVEPLLQCSVFTDRVIKTLLTYIDIVGVDVVTVLRVLPW